MYNTGDLGAWREDGEIEMLGRVDDQIKIKVRHYILLFFIISTY